MQDKKSTQLSKIYSYNKKEFFFIEKQINQIYKLGFTSKAGKVMCVEIILAYRQPSLM